MSGHLERLEAILDRDPDRFLSTEEGDLRAALDELKRGRAERHSEFRLLLAELEAAKSEARNLQACMLLVVHRYGYDGKLTFHEGDLRRAQRWLESLAADAAPQQPERGGEATCGPACSEMHTYELGQCEAAVLGAEDDDCPQCKAKRTH